VQCLSDARARQLLFVALALFAERSANDSSGEDWWAHKDSNLGPAD